MCDGGSASASTVDLRAFLSGVKSFFTNEDTAPTGSGLPSALAFGSGLGLTSATGLLTVGSCRRAERRAGLLSRFGVGSNSGRDGGIGTEASWIFAAASGAMIAGSADSEAKTGAAGFGSTFAATGGGATRFGSKVPTGRAIAIADCAGAIVSVRTTFGLMTSVGFGFAVFCAICVSGACGDSPHSRTAAP